MAQRSQPLLFAPTGSRIRAEHDGRTVVDSRAAALLRRSSDDLTYGFPPEALQAELVTGAEPVEDAGVLGPLEPLHVDPGGRRIERAAFRLPTPGPGAPDTRGYVFVRFDAMDAWYEEDERLMGHPRDPLTRIDVRRSSLAVRVAVDGVTIADTHSPLLLFETGLPVRYYIPWTDVREELLAPSATETVCCYKGRARYWNVVTESGEHADLAWSYPEPLQDGERVRDAVCFQQSRLDLYLDGESQRRAPIFFGA